MRAAIYSPYLDTASGGERYMLMIAKSLTGLGSVDVLLDDHLLEIGSEKIKILNEQRHQIDLEQVNFIKAPVGPNSKTLKRNSFLKKYDVLFYNTDGSIFYSPVKKSFVHIQMPLEFLQAKGVVNKIKWRTWKKIIYNSDFTKNYTEKKLKKSGVVIYPPVNTQRFLISETRKKNQILNVGRFVGDGVKKQHVLIEAFKRLMGDKSLNEWELHLAGALRENDQQYFDDLKSLSHGLKVFLHPNISFNELTNLYLSSKVYWHSMGYDEEDPSRSEHFGISTVEAMAAGCVPIVINKGGQREIVEEGVNGFLWDTLDDLVSKTREVVKKTGIFDSISIKAKQSSERFSDVRFKKDIIELLNE